MKAVIFDLDGTLLDSVSVILRSTGEVCRAMGMPFDEERMRKMIGVPLRVQAPRIAGEREAEFIERYREVYRRNQDGRARLFPGTEQMLQAVRHSGHVTALVTSKATRGTKRILEETALLDKFDAIITADDVVHHKPHPEPLIKALDVLRVRPEEAVYVGDSLFDIDSAQRAGVHMVAVTWGARSRQDLELGCPELIIDSWEEFLHWLNAADC